MHILLFLSLCRCFLVCRRRTRLFLIFTSLNWLVTIFSLFSFFSFLFFLWLSLCLCLYALIPPTRPFFTLEQADKHHHRPPGQARVETTHTLTRSWINHNHVLSHSGNEATPPPPTHRSKIIDQHQQQHQLSSQEQMAPHNPPQVNRQPNLHVCSPLLSGPRSSPTSSSTMELCLPSRRQLLPEPRPNNNNSNNRHQ
ncbi:hypothetical protein F5H01DRAFT_45240 [Linnemannia elongata]|nr:hypothetical protein F5H01DRAFT_45240 [Linnemannia elongata]